MRESKKKEVQVRTGREGKTRKNSTDKPLGFRARNGAVRKRRRTHQGGLCGHRKLEGGTRAGGSGAPKDCADGRLRDRQTGTISEMMMKATISRSSPSLSGRGLLWLAGWLAGMKYDSARSQGPRDVSEHGYGGVNKWLKRRYRPPVPWVGIQWE